MAGEAWRSIDAYLAAKHVRFGAPTLAQTTGGKHAPGSLHYVGRARDYGRTTSDLPAILEVLLPFAVGPGHSIAELFGLRTYWKAGRIFKPSAALLDSHQDHVHVGLRAGATLPKPARPVEVPPMADDPDVPNMTGPVELHLVVNAAGLCTGYYLFSPATGEVHGHGPGAPYHGRSEVVQR